MIIFPLLGSASNFNIFVILSVLTGFIWFNMDNNARAAMTPRKCVLRRNLFGFSVHSCERVSTLIGPLSWGLITSLFIGFGPTRYRIAVTAMAVFIAIGIFF